MLVAYCRRVAFKRYGAPELRSRAAGVGMWSVALELCKRAAGVSKWGMEAWSPGAALQTCRRGGMEAWWCTAGVETWRDESMEL